MLVWMSWTRWQSILHLSASLCCCGRSDVVGVCVYLFQMLCRCIFVDRQTGININNMLLSLIVKSPISPMCLCSLGLLPKWIHKTVTTQFDFPQPESSWRHFITSCQQTLSVTFWTFLCCIGYSSRRPFGNTYHGVFVISPANLCFMCYHSLFVNVLSVIISFFLLLGTFTL